MANILNEKDICEAWEERRKSMECVGGVKKRNEKTAREKEDSGRRNSLYYSAVEVKKMLEISRGKAYQIIKKMNDELEQNGYITIAGKIPKKYFNERFYGLDERSSQIADVKAV